jgi:biotin transporter BioY
MGFVDDWSWASTWGRYTAPFLIGDGIKAVAAVIIVRYLKDRLNPWSSAD